MGLFEILVLLLLSLILALCGFVAYRLLSVKNAFRELQVVYFTETQNREKVFKKESVVQIKGQLLLGGIPVGHPFLLSEQVTETVDKEKVNRLLEEFAGPLLVLGLKVVTRKLV